MKTTAKIALAALAISALAFDGCKKGANDPFLSIHTRKARVAGDWTAKSGSGSYGTTGNMTTWTFDGTTYSQTVNSNTTTNGLSYTANFEKDGTFKIVITSTTTGSSDVETMTGTWNFTAGVGDAKNKDHIVLRTLSDVDVLTVGTNSNTSTNTYTGDSAPTTIWYIDELKNKEMIVKWDGTDNDGTTTQTDTGTWTFQQ